MSVDDSRLTAARAAGRCYVVAEAGSNHDGMLSRALALVEAAANGGADAVKFQLFTADRLYVRDAGVADYLGGPDIHEVVSAVELSPQWLPRLAGRAAEHAIDLLVTPFDEEAVATLDPYVPAFKVASYELTHHPLLKAVARTGKPIILSTGASELDEVRTSLEVLRAAGASDITVLQCTAAYPARIEALNLRAMRDLAENLAVPVGLSDHSADPIVAPVAAVALGASVLEKHVTLDRHLPGPDHRFAIEPDELRALVRAVRDTEAALGDGAKHVHADEQQLRTFARRWIFVIRDVAEGELLDAGNVAVLRAGKRGEGLPPAEYERVLGRRAARALAANEPLRAADVA